MSRTKGHKRHVYEKGVRVAHTETQLKTFTASAIEFFPEIWPDETTWTTSQWKNDRKAGERLPHHRRTLDLSMYLTCNGCLCTAGLQWLGHLVTSQLQSVRATSQLTWPLGYRGHTTDREDSHLSIIVRHNRDSIAFQFARELYVTTGTQVSRVTVPRRLYERGLFKEDPLLASLSALRTGESV
ncbi:hypothetical protein TNCV_5062711 [Trichonephila clavipes]|nr:hypothetical protein TNCV_5062711 [Trichonephila clavipes]